MAIKDSILGIYHASNDYSGINGCLNGSQDKMNGIKWYLRHIFDIKREIRDDRERDEEMV